MWIIRICTFSPIPASARARFHSSVRGSTSPSGLFPRRGFCFGDVTCDVVHGGYGFCIHVSSGNAALLSMLRKGAAFAARQDLRGAIGFNFVRHLVAG